MARLRRGWATTFRQLQIFARLDEPPLTPPAAAGSQLERPEAVTFAYTGDKTAGSGTFKPEGTGSTPVRSPASRKTCGCHQGRGFPHPAETNRADSTPDSTKLAQVRSSRRTCATPSRR